MASSYDELDVKVYVDHPQYRRNIKSPFVYAVDGTCWDTSTAVNAYIEPVTRTVMGQPVPNTPGWRTTFTGQGYTRYQFTDFTFTSPSSWKDINFYGTDPYFYCLSNTTSIMNAAISLNGGVVRNQPLFFSFIKQNKKESSTNITAKLFWAGSSFIDKDTQLHLKDDGSADLYRGYILKTGAILCTTSSVTVTGSGTLFLSELSTGDVLYTEDGILIGTISTVGSNTSLNLSSNAAISYAGRFHKKEAMKVATYSRNENNYNQQAVGIRNSNPNNDYNDVYIMPMRGKELIVNTSYGLNFSHTFDDLNDPNEPQNNNAYYLGINSGITSTSNQLFMLPEVLPGGAFSIVIPNGKVAFQLAKLYFLSNWSIKSNIITNEVAQQGYSNMGYTQPTILPGTISGSTYSTTITGLLTSFNSSYVNGRLFSLNADGTTPTEIGTINAVSSTTSLTLSSISPYLFNGSYYSIITKKTGTITGNTSSNIITGVGTLFTTEIAINDDLYDSNDYYLGKVQNISSNTSLTLYYNSMTDVSGSSYWANIPSIESLYSNPSSEMIGPVSSTQYTDIPIPTVQVLFNENATDKLSTSTFARIKLSSNSTSDPSNALKNNDTTHCVYSADYIVTHIPQKTKTTQVDITSAIEHLSIERREEGEIGVSLSARKQNLVDLGMTNPDLLSNRPIKITLKPRDTSYSEVLIFDGFLKNPDIEYIQGVNYDKYALLTFEAYCKKQSLNDIYFTKAPSYDSQPYTATIINLIQYGGILTRNSVYDFHTSLLGYYFGINRNNASGQYNWTANISDSVGSFIEKIRSEISQNITFKYNTQWYFSPVLNKWINTDGISFIDRKSNQDGNTFNPIALYLNDTTANVNGSIPLHKTYKRTIRSLKRTYEAPEANQVVVIGIDKTNNSRITSIIDDVNSQNPFITTRPNNWLGTVKSFTYINDRLNSANIVSKSAQSFFNKISTGREIVEFTSDFLTYFNDFSKNADLEPLPAKSGTITTSTSSNIVTGSGTAFTSELSVGNVLYTPDGYMIGTVLSITNSVTLTLSSNALITTSAIQYYTRSPYKWLYQYDFLDADDDVEIFDLTGTSNGKYKIISWKVDFVKNNIPQYISGVLQNPDIINVAQCSYKAIKTSYSNKYPIYEKDIQNITFENNINVLKNVASKVVLSFNTNGTGITYTTLGMPSGMTASTSSFINGQQDIILNWTPSPAQSKAVANTSITVNNAYGSGSSYTVKLYFKVFDTL